MPKGFKAGGRQKGTPNRATAAKAAAIAESGLTPLDYMLQVLRDPKQDYDVRLDAAKGAAPYVHPKLANIELSGNKDKPLHVSVVQFTNPTKPVGSSAVPDASVVSSGTGLPPRRTLPSPPGRQG